MASLRDVSTRCAVLACLLPLGCAADPTGPLAPGIWGGTGISFDVSPDSAVVEFDCAHGIVRGPISLRDGQFRRAGDFILERGGPIREGEPPDLRAAVYTGVISGGTLEITIQVEGIAQDLGPYVVRRGAAPVIRRCL